MIKVIVHNDRVQKCWYIDRTPATGPPTAKICYESRERALAVAHQRNPYMNIYVED
jgi:hypothetical protein